MRITLLLAIFLPATLPAGPRLGDEGTPEYQAATELVRRLGDPRFNTREVAAKKLVEMGLSAIPALRTGSKSADEEIRSRSAALLPRAEAVGWKRKADAFLADPTAHRDLPLLAEWEKLTGKSNAGTRKLYADVLAAAGPLLEQAAADKKAGLTALAARAKSFLAPARTAAVQVEATAGDVAAVLLVQAYLKPPSDTWGGDDRQDPLYMLANSATRTALGERDIGRAFGRLLAGWIESRPADDYMAGMYFVVLAHRRPFPEADPVLVRLATKHWHTQLQWMAMDALGQSGSATAVGALTGLLGDTSVMYGRDNEDAAPQVRDCALAALVAANGRDPKAYKLGVYTLACFWFGGPADTVTVRMHSFASAADREAGRKKWRAEATVKK